MENKRRALGRGLEQLFNNDNIDFETFESNIIDSTPKDDIINVDLNKLRSNPYKPRKIFNDEALEELATSIKEHGVFQPIIVKRSISGYEIVAGERRVKASLKAGLDKIPAIVRDFSDNEMMEIALLENLQRENLTAIEEAWAYRNLIDNLNITQDALSLKVGKSRSHITNMLGLLRLPESVQKMILANQISMGHARVLSKLSDNDKIRELADKIISKDLSVREVEELSSTNGYVKKVPIANRRQESDSEYHLIEKTIREKLGTKTKINNRKLEIYFDSIKDLNRILEILNIDIDE